MYFPWRLLRPVMMSSSFFPIRPMNQLSVTSRMDTPSIIVESAMMLGLIPCFTAPKIAVGRVSTPCALYESW